MSKPLPDIEKALIAALKANSTVTAEVSIRISTELPARFDTTHGEKRIQLFNTTGSPVDVYTEAAHRPIIQVNSFGSTKDEAFDVVSVAYQAVRDLEQTVHAEITIGAVDLITGPAWFPDPETDIPRYIMTFTILTRSR